MRTSSRNLLSLLQLYTSTQSLSVLIRKRPSLVELRGVVPACWTERGNCKPWCHVFGPSEEGRLLSCALRNWHRLCVIWRLREEWMSSGGSAAPHEGIFLALIKPFALKRPVEAVGWVPVLKKKIIIIKTGALFIQLSIGTINLPHNLS